MISGVWKNKLDWIMKASLLKPYSIGVVAANKLLTTRDIEVTPIEALNFADGDISDNISKYLASGKDTNGQSYNLEVDTTLTVQATWLPLGSNRRTAPDVRRGEVVLIWQYADQDKYYWTSMLYDGKLRKLETVVWMFSNTTNEDEEATSENTYFVEVSTHTQHVTLHTSKSNGEPFAWTMQINTKDGVFTVTDNAGDYITIDGKNTRIEMKNADGSWVDLDKRNIKITAPDTITMKAGKDINMSAGSNINGDAGSSINWKTSKITTQASTTTNTVPNTTFTGNVNIGLKMSSNGMAVNSGGGGGFVVSGPGQFTGQVNVNQLTSTNNIIAPNVH